MAIYLRKLLEKAWEFELTLVAGKEGLDRSVSWFHMVESMEAAAFTKVQEIIITTGAGLNGSSLLNMVIMAEQKHSGCMIVGLGPYIKEIAQDILDYCNVHRYPLLTIPWHVSIAAMMRNFAYQILEAEKASIELSSALKSVISFPQKRERYVHTFLQYGFREDGRYCMAVLELEEQIEGPVMARIVKSIEDILMAAGDKSFVLNAEGILMLLFSNYSEEQIHAILLRMIAALRPICPGFYTGIGKEQQGMDMISVSYMQARRVVELNRRTGVRNMLVHYSELGLYKLLMAVENIDLLQEFYRKTIGVLEEYDKANKTNYMETLEIFLQNNCSTGETAEKMFVHRNTISYKIHKIEELLDCNMNELDTKVNLYVSCMLKAFL